MKNLLVLTCILFSTICMNAQQAIEGVWNTGKENTKIEIKEGADGAYAGTVISSDNTNAKIGKQLIKDVKLVDGEWKGKLFAAKKKKWMDATLKEKGNQLLITTASRLRPYM